MNLKAVFLIPLFGLAVGSMGQSNQSDVTLPSPSAVVPQDIPSNDILSDAFGSASAPATVAPNMLGDYFLSATPPVRRKDISGDIAKMEAAAQEINRGLNQFRANKGSVTAYNTVQKGTDRALRASLDLASKVDATDQDRIERLAKFVDQLVAVRKFLREVHGKLEAL